MLFRLKSLSTELAIVFASISVALVGLLSYFTFDFISQSLEDTVRRDLLNTVDQAVRAIDGEIQERLREVEIVSLSPTIRDAAVFLSEAHATIPQRERVDEPRLRRRFNGKVCPEERPDLTQHLRAIQSAHTYISSFLVTDRLGIAIACTSDPGKFMHRQETWWQEAVMRGVSLSNLEFDASTLTYTFAVALPIPDKGHDAAGVVRAVFNLRAIQDSVGAVRIGENGFVMAMGRDGRIFAHPRSAYLWKKVEEIPELSYLREVVAAATPRGVLLYHPPTAAEPSGAARQAANSFSGSAGGTAVTSSGPNKHGWMRGEAPAASLIRRPHDTGKALPPSLANASADSWLLAYSRMFRPASLGPLGWTVVGTVSRSEAISPIVVVRNRVFFLETVFVLLAVPFVWLVSWRLARPLNDLARRADLIAAGDLSVDLNVPSRNEIARLASALSSMMDSVRESNRSLVRTNANLEKIVAERTRELEDKTRLLEEQSKQVLEASRLKSQFLANMSHELRTPLNAILALSEILAERISGDLNDEQVKQVTIINRSGRNLLRLINDILDLSKIEAGRMDVHLAALELRNSLSAVRDTIEPLAAEKGLKFEIMSDPALPALIRSDDAKIRQVLVNLLGNAVKFTERGVISLVLSRRHRALPGSEDTPPPMRDDAPFWLELKVSDTGIGIAPLALSKIFDEFQQADGSTTRKYGGTGLGLAISKKIVELMGGEISVESVLGKGSTFRALIPAEGIGTKALDTADSATMFERPEAGSPAEWTPDRTRAEIRGLSEEAAGGAAPANVGASSSRAQRRASAAASAGGPVGPGKKKWISPLLEHPIPASPRFLDIHDDTDNWLPHIPTLLVVDDDPESLYVYRQFLSRQGYQIIFAINGEQVMEKARQFHPVAIILDLMLPHKSGWEVLEELKVTDDLAEIPVIISSVLDHRERGVCAGAFRYLTKPMSEKQLLGVLKELEKARRKNLRSVLVIDDDPVEIGIARTLFEKAGLDVTAFQSGEEALAWATEERPDIIVLDLMMPGMDGFEALSRLKAEPKTASIPVLVYTAKDITEDERKRLVPSACRIFPKIPFQFEEMLDELDRALRTVPLRAQGGERGAPAPQPAMMAPSSLEAEAAATANLSKPTAAKPPSPTSAVARAAAHDDSASTEEKPPPASETTRPAQPRGGGHRARILLVEDDLANQYSVSFMLRSEGYEVLIAENGVEGLEQAERHRPDVILMDMMMPVMSGFDATKQLKGRAGLREIPVIALTAAAMAGDRERTLAAGCDDYVSKPISRQHLLERIRHWLAVAAKEAVGA